MRWLVDGMNVIGSRADGWWRDRDGAARRLVASLQAWAARGEDEITVATVVGPQALLSRLPPAVTPSRKPSAPGPE